MKLFFYIAYSFFFLLWPLTSFGQSTYEIVKQRGWLSCGVQDDLPGFGERSTTGVWDGLEADLCRAVAAASLGDAKKVQFKAVPASLEKFSGLYGGEIDLLLGNTSWTLIKNTSLEIDFPVVNFFDGQGFLLRRNIGIESLTQFSNISICVESGGMNSINLQSYFKEKGLKVNIKKYEEAKIALREYVNNKCSVYTSNISQLAGVYSKLADKEDHVILPELISKEPQSPAIRQGDPKWSNIVRWSIYALLTAEELGITSSNLDESLRSRDPNIRLFLGLEGDLGKSLGLSSDWALQIVKQVGNYQEIYDRNLGEKSNIKMIRGVNKLWKYGGLQYPMPMR